MAKKVTAQEKGMYQKLIFWRAVSAILLLMVILTFAVISWNYLMDSAVEFNLLKIQGSAPYHKEIEKIIEPLRYSGVKRFLDPSVCISLDFENETWRLHNIHKFDNKGQIILDESRYGICGELAVYAYQKIRPIFGDRYKISFLGSAESGFFNSVRASHVVLRIVEPSFLSPTVYILDPSFRRYGRIDEFEDYIFLEVIDPRYMLDTAKTDEVFPVGNTSPLLIRKKSLMQIVVERNGDKFDKNNFVLALTATKKHKFAGRYVFALRKNEGKIETFENKMLANQLLKHEEYEALCARLRHIFEAM